jgi:hypothetical protein
MTVTLRINTRQLIFAPVPCAPRRRKAARRSQQPSVEPITVFAMFQMLTRGSE